MKYLIEQKSSCLIILEIYDLVCALPRFQGSKVRLKLLSNRSISSSNSPPAPHPFTSFRVPSLCVMSIDIDLEHFPSLSSERLTNMDDWAPWSTLMKVFLAANHWKKLILPSYKEDIILKTLSQITDDNPRYKDLCDRTIAPEKVLNDEQLKSVEKCCYQLVSAVDKRNFHLIKNLDWPSDIWAALASRFQPTEYQVFKKMS